ncbi:YTH domain-containing protein 1 isoform X2 [Neocloeon triangulifer]|uniref:YTH domain-containing protein 1 isoform X2 n=1 Tax=Neocloeon triangulifer TaxID=2078957 RepID=UPI00286FA0ED|nr:YTH domain-containing protein 1 isoform X2 [Neocloeon triangulifer]
MDVALEAVSENLDTSEEDLLLKNDKADEATSFGDEEAADAALEAELSPNDHLDLKDEDTLKDYDTRSEISNASQHSLSSAGSFRSGKNNGLSEKEGSPPPSKKRSPIVVDSRRTPSPKRTAVSSKSYDYATKLNYLFRGARFFLMKSNNAENIALSKAKGVWSTLPINETKLNQAFRESRNVLLVYSVKESGKFAGFARLATESQRDVAPVSWVLPSGLSAKALGGVFDVDWICRKELPFSKTLHLYNPWNDSKAVKIGRDGQEIEPRVAEELCRLFPEDPNIDMTPILRKSKAASKRVGGSVEVQTRRLETRMRRAPPRSRLGRRRGGGGRPAEFGRMPRRGSRYDDDDYRPRRGARDLAVVDLAEMRDRSPIRFSDRSYTAPSPYSYYMQELHRSAPVAPLPYPAPPPFESAPKPPPRYYDSPPDYSRSSRLDYDSHVYDRSVDEFLRRTSDRREDRRERDRDRRERASRDERERYYSRR